MSIFVATGRRRKAPKLWKAIPAALMSGVGIALLVMLALTFGYQAVYRGRILPGVVVAGVDLSGQTPAEAAARLEQALAYPQHGRIVFRDGEHFWQASPAELGLRLEVQASAREAYRIGRQGVLRALAEQVNAAQGAIHLPVVVIFDQQQAYRYLQNLAAQINQPLREAELRLEGTEVIYIPGQVGRSLDVGTTLRALTRQLQSLQDGEVPLTVVEQRPLVLDAAHQAEALRTLLSQPLTLVLPEAEPGDPGPWVVEASTLARMLVIEPQAGQFLIQVDSAALGAVLQEINGAIRRAPQNARFIFNDETRQLELLQPAVTGRELNLPLTEAAIQSRLLSGEHTIRLEIITQPPIVGNDATAEALGITELVSDPVYSVTYFRGSTAARIQNIRLAAARFHGLLVAPGETFSMGAALGDISLENGYQEAMIIYNGRTIKGVGGGVCQVSTTLFRTVFFAGYPILERHAHAYRVSYYEQTPYGLDPNLAGMDATVYFPLVDFKFVNDTPYWLLMETYVNERAQRLTWKFYSTRDGRSVTWTTTGPRNVVPAPAPLFRLNPDLSPGSMKQVDWAADGADVYVTRTVSRDGQVLFSDEFATHYQPWQAVCEYGPGVDDPARKAKELNLCQP